MQKILILGGTRFIGLPLLQKLSSAQLYCFHRGIHPLPIWSNATSIYGNRSNPHAVESLFETCYDVVIDLSGEDQSFVLHSARAAQKKAGKYVYLSSSSVYRYSPTAHSELDPLKTQRLSEYTKAKIAGEHIVQEFHQNHLIVRTSKVYGPNNHINREQFFLRQIINQKPISIKKNPVLHFTYVDDLADGIVRAIDCDCTGTYNIAGKEPALLTSFIIQIGECIHQKPMIQYANTSDTPLTNLDTCILKCDKMIADCGWSAKTGLSEGLFQTVQYLKERII